ncbi:uncharacterized protein LOC132637318 [Lycium barbarum]|uniref:uncharacterized protein LOC132637318 n=1 Tax=Lycium barbarum TaxID=112863 RepID=UPI00293E9E34|nr:uncharacterized protein LOC132637318 [Lycium barbarum]
MEYLSRNLSELTKDRQYKFHPLCAKLKITHLSFADDLFLFVKGDRQFIQLLYAKFTIFSQASGLQVNLSKSSIYFGGVDNTELGNTEQLLGIEHGQLPFKYLGIPLVTKKLSILQWQPLIQKIVARISSWIAKKLSYIGRVQLVKSVIFGIQSYLSQLFLIPAKVIKTIEAYFRSDIWSGTNEITKRALVSWSTTCLPKIAGGLHLFDLKLWNKTAVAKMCWDLAYK